MSNEQNQHNLTLRFQLSDVEYDAFQKKMSSLGIRAAASRLPQIKFFYRVNETQGMHLVEIGLQNPNDVSQYDLIGALIRESNNRQYVDLLGQYASSTQDDYKEVMSKQDIRTLPCSVCGRKLKTRRKMYLMLDNQTGEYEYVGNECVHKLLPEWTLKSFQKLMINLMKLQKIFANEHHDEIKQVSTISVLKDAYQKLQTENGNQTHDEFLKASASKIIHQKIFDQAPNVVYAQKKSSGIGTADFVAYPGIAPAKITKPINDNVKKLLSYKENEGNANNMYWRGAINLPDFKNDDSKNQFTHLINIFANNLVKFTNQLNIVNERKENIKLQNPNQLIDFSESLKLIQRNRETPEKSGYNLREALNAQEIPLNLVNRIKKAYLNFLNSKIKSSDDAIKNDYLKQYQKVIDDDTLHKLNLVDNMFVENATKINQAIKLLIKH